MKRNSFLLPVVAGASAAHADSLKDVKHIVLFMQENRAFDHVSCSTLHTMLVANILIVLWHYGRRPRLWRPKRPGQR